MLTRILTGFVLAIITIVSCFLLPNSLFNPLVGIIFSLAAYEWLALVTQRFYYQVMYIGGLWVLGLMGSQFLPAYLLIALVWWVVVLALLFLPMSKLSWFKHPMVLAIAGYCLFVPAWASAVEIHSFSRLMAFTVIMFVAFNDTAAYFVGSKLGRRKLAPVLSPNKTLEGLVGGLLIGLIAGMSMVALMPGINFSTSISWLILGIITILVSIVGDLFESMVKRVCEVKDSGSLLPGHGGMLDRLDSLCAALPIFAIGALYFLT